MKFENWNHKIYTYTDGQFVFLDGEKKGLGDVAPLLLKDTVKRAICSFGRELDDNEFDKNWQEMEKILKDGLKYDQCVLDALEINFKDIGIIIKLASIYQKKYLAI